LNEDFQLLNMLLLVPLAISTLIALRLLFGGAPVESTGTMRRVMRLVGWILLATASAAMLYEMSFVFALFIGLALIITPIRSWLRLRRTDREGLLWALVIAAERNLPLHQAAWAFAAEQRSVVGSPAWRLGDMLRTGAPLPVAIDYVRMGISIDALIAVRFGELIGCLPGTLREALAADRRLRDAAAPLVRHFCYLVLMLIAVAIAGVFLNLKMIPVFSRLLVLESIEPESAYPLFSAMSTWIDALTFEFNSLPGPVQLGIDFLLGIGLFIGAALMFLEYFELIPRNVPLIWLLHFPADRSRVLRGLAWAVTAHRPLPAAMESLGRLFPRGKIGRRLTRAASMAREGRHWTETLRTVGLLSSAEMALLQSCERAGNLDWGLRQLADRNLQRHIRRLHRLRGWLVPLTIVALGVVIGLIYSSLLYPLILILETIA
jgi:type II secretory pathway component PulF